MRLLPEHHNECFQLYQIVIHRLQIMVNRVRQHSCIWISNHPSYGMIAMIPESSQYRTSIFVYKYRYRFVSNEVYIEKLRDECSIWTWRELGKYYNRGLAIMTPEIMYEELLRVLTLLIEMLDYMEVLCTIKPFVGDLQKTLYRYKIV